MIGDEINDGDFTENYRMFNNNVQKMFPNPKKLPFDQSEVYRCPFILHISLFFRYERQSPV